MTDTVPRKTKKRSVDSDSEVVVVKSPVSKDVLNKERRDKIMIAKNSDMNDPRFKVVYDAVKTMIVGQQFNIRQFTIMVPLAAQKLIIKFLNGMQQIFPVIQITDIQRMVH